MSVLARSGSCCYPVSDVWMHAAANSDAPAYVDIDEIRNEQTGNQPRAANELHGAPNTPLSAYLTWILANDPGIMTREDGTNCTRLDHVMAAQFIDNGIRIGATEKYGDNLRGIMKGAKYITVNEYVGGINHPERYRRVYRNNTQVERFSFVGYSES